MPKTYLQLDPSDDRYHKILDVMSNHHRHLQVAGVTLTVLMASGPRDQNGDVSGPAIKVAGYEALASIRITSLAERAVVGTCDVVLKLDADHVDELSEAQFVALIDDQFSELALKIGKEGEVVRDDLTRPVLKKVRPDIHISGFIKNAIKHKEASQVVAAVAMTGTEFVKQGVLQGF